MKVLQLAKFYPPVIGGMEQIVYGINEGLNSKGIKSDVLCANDKNQYIKEEISDYTVYRARSMASILSTSIAPQLIALLKQLNSQYEILHVHLPNPMMTLALFLAGPSAKIIIHWHSDIRNIPRSLLVVFDKLEDWLLRRADAIIATSPSYIEGSKYLLKFRSKVSIIPLFINTDHIIVDQNKKDEIKALYGKRKIIFSLGRMVYYKGFEYLIEAAKYLNDDYIILIGGDGSLRNKLNKKIIALGLINKVILVGMISEFDLGAYYSACDVFCLPSVNKSEAFGVVQLEAMSMSKPLISCYIEGSGVDWVNLNDNTGLTVPPRDAKALASAISKICTDHKLYERYSMSSFERFGRLFSKDLAIKGIIELYTKVMNGTNIDKKY